MTQYYTMRNKKEKMRYLLPLISRESNLLTAFDIRLENYHAMQKINDKWELLSRNHILKGKNSLGYSIHKGLNSLVHPIFKTK